MFEMLTKDDVNMIIRNELCVERIDEIKANIESGTDLKLTEAEKSQLKQAVQFLQTQISRYAKQVSQSGAISAA